MTGENKPGAGQFGRQDVPILEINANGKAQLRAVKIDESVVSEYADAMERGDEFPPVTLFCDGETYWPGDGHHRIAAARRIDREAISAEVRQGALRDAILHAAGANAAHGLQRDNDTKRNAVEILLRDPEWNHWSDRQIAKACRVGHTFVAKTRRTLSGIDSTERTYRTKHGTVATMRTGGVGRVTGIDSSDAGSNGGVFAKVLSKVPDDVLVEECLRRGLEVPR